MARPVRRLVFGLGNPGSSYEGTRHNVGFRVVEHLARHEGLLFDAPDHLEGYDGPRGFRCARLYRPSALLVEPLTFMNRSGEIVAPLVRWTGCELGDLLVVYDDLDLPVGTLRIRPSGGHGGHNGMRSIHTHLGSDRFPRLRVGIGRSTTDAARHVLSAFSPEEEVEIGVAVAEAAGAILDWLGSGDLEGCMSRFHSRWKAGEHR